MKVTTQGLDLASGTTEYNNDGGAGNWTGNLVALPNNRVRVTHPAWFQTGEGPPDFLPSQHIHYSKSDLDYTLDTNQIFNNLYSED